jgi:hypothetical protein
MSHTVMQSGNAAPDIAWKDHETDYCRSLVMSCATREVPEQSILSYLEVQIISAFRDSEPDAVRYLNDLRRYWMSSARYLALLDPTRI